MKLSDIEKRLQAPFPSSTILWKAVQRDGGNEAFFAPFIEWRSVAARLNAICPDDWQGELQPIPGGPNSATKARLTVLGVVREDIGTGGDFSRAAENAYLRCGTHFGLGCYLLDVKVRAPIDPNNAAIVPLIPITLPQWALPDHERTAGGAHLIQAIEQLKYELPDDHELQKVVYGHLKAALHITK